jgi:hypothetical protein
VDSPSRSAQVRLGRSPEAIIRRAADYMIRRYGFRAAIRAKARCRRLTREGRSDLAEEWLRVASAIEAAGPTTEDQDSQRDSPSPRVGSREKVNT